MATIKIKGIGTKEIPRDKAISLKKQLDDGTLGRGVWINLDDISFLSSDITAITTEATEKTSYGNVTNEIDNEYYKDRGLFLGLSLDEKSKKMYFFDLFYKIMTDSDAKPDVHEKAQQIQYEFFSKNPYRMYCDPNAYRPLIEGNKAKLGKFLHIIERIVATDMDYTKYKLCRRPQQEYVEEPKQEAPLPVLGTPNKPEIGTRWNNNF